MSTVRERVVEAAAEAIYKNGYGGTTLAVVAKTAGLPLGNLYYHFRAKDTLLEAVLEKRMGEIEFVLGEAEKRAPGRDRLVAVIEAFRGNAEPIAAFGCPYGTLSSELEKRKLSLQFDPKRLLGTVIEWMRGEFRAAGLGSADAQLQAETLLCSMQGATVVGHALGSPDLVRAQLDALVPRLDALLASRTQP